MEVSDRRGRRAQLAALEQQRRSLIAALVKIDARISGLRSGSAEAPGVEQRLDDEPAGVNSDN